MNIYEFEMTARCPNNHAVDKYFCRLESVAMIQVELILEWIKSSPERVLFQEQLATEMREKFGARSTVIGCHMGVRVSSIRE